VNSPAVAAGRVAAYGLREVAGLLDTKFKLSWEGARSAIPRHQTLSATLDWSYNLFSETEQSTLCRLSVFMGFFSLQAAQAVCSSENDDDSVVPVIATLVSKSLISTDLYGGRLKRRIAEQVAKAKYQTLPNIVSLSGVAPWRS
jgi:predicted ATPase